MAEAEETAEPAATAEAEEEETAATEAAVPAPVPPEVLAEPLAPRVPDPVARAPQEAAAPTALRAPMGDTDDYPEAKSQLPVQI